MAFYNNTNQIFPAFRQEDGKVIGRIREGVKSAFPSTGGQDYRFFVEPLSPLPRGYEDAQRVGFTGFMSRIGYDCSFFPSEEAAWKALSAEWGGSLVVFTPALRNGKYFVLDDIERESQPLAMTDETRFVPVPVFAAEDGPAFDGDINKFCAQLAEGKPLPGLPKKYWDHCLLPALVAASFRDGDTGRKKLYALFAPLREDTFSQVVLSEGGAYFECAGKDDLGYTIEDMETPDITSHVVMCRHSPVCFIPEEMIPKFRASMKPVPEDGIIFPSAGRKPAGVVLRSAGRQVPQWSAPETGEAPAQDDRPPMKRESAGYRRSARPAPVKPDSPEKSGEALFLERLEKAAEDRGLLYDKKDLVNFHVSVKSSRLVILAGMSGTGKSGLIRLYSQALGLPAAQTLMIPVRPSWMDDSDILGYVDMKTMTYRPADTGLAELLIEAERHPEKMYIVCFDEMNLARAEHYFAQFISVLEREEMPAIRLYNPALAPRIYNSTAYPAEIPIGRNVIFTGTVNVDESTYHFSDKILDRANVITLHQRKFQDLLRLRGGEGKPCEEVSAGSFDAFRAPVPSPILTSGELAFLDALNETLQSGMQSGIGYRAVRQMGLYLSNIPAGSGFTREDGLDLQTVQRIFTKLRGSSEQLAPLLTLGENDVLTGKVPAVLDQFRNLSPFTEARAALMKKAKELKLYDYTI